MQSISVTLGRRHRPLHVRALLAKRNGGEQEVCQVHSRSPLGSQLLHQKWGRFMGTVTGRRMGITSASSRTRSRRNARRNISWVFTTGSSAMRSSARTCLTLAAMKKYVVRWTKLAKEDHTDHITPDEIRVYRNNWWIRSNTVGSDTMPVRHRADFKEAFSTLRRLKNAEDTAYYQKWQSSSSAWWNWQESWWHSSSEYHRDDGSGTDW